jgi:hypothetical protein
MKPLVSLDTLDAKQQLIYLNLAKAFALSFNKSSIFFKETMTKKYFFDRIR